MVGLQFGEH